MKQSYKSPEQMEQEINRLQEQLAAATQQTIERIECNPENIEQGLARLVLSLIELLRRLLERQR